MVNAGVGDQKPFLLEDTDILRVCKHLLHFVKGVKLTIKMNITDKIWYTWSYIRGSTDERFGSYLTIKHIFYYREYCSLK